MGEKAKTVEKTVKKEVKDVKDSQEATPDVPEMEVTEEEAQEFTEEYTEPASVEVKNITELNTLGRIRANELWKLFIPTYVLECETTAQIRDGKITISALDPSKISAARVSADVHSDFEGQIGFLPNVQGKIIRYKGEEIELKGTEVPEEAVIKGGISIGRDMTREVSIAVPLIGTSNSGAELVEKLIERFDSEKKWVFQVNVKHFAKIIREFEQEFPQVAILTVGGKLAIYGEHDIGAMASSITEATTFDVGYIGLYPADYLKEFAEILTKMGFEVAELRFTGKDAPLWLHAEKNEITADLIVAPSIADADTETYVTVAKAIL